MDSGGTDQFSESKSSLKHLEECESQRVSTANAEIFCNFKGIVNLLYKKDREMELKKVFLNEAILNLISVSQLSPKSFIVLFGNEFCIV
eukprot:snap_masked-scaffold_24-processed-gene-2.28-mRNA-1 protein AED:1.00 eAED:1.00 QI:0/-1/0/0/-1/1/1/0/88